MGVSENSKRIFQQAVAEGRIPAGDAQHRLIEDFKARLRRALELEQEKDIRDRKRTLFAKSDDAAMERFLGRAEEDQQRRAQREAQEQAKLEAEEEKARKQH